ncbi:MAG: ATP-dependent Clp protease proteolytic subunit [Elusimicrobiota bacterium]|nr:ATP-dependent Clp protease proteolytic subunit [Elusimicrobiota bacterium]
MNLARLSLAAVIVLTSSPLPAQMPAPVPESPQAAPAPRAKRKAKADPNAAVPAVAASLPANSSAASAAPAAPAAPADSASPATVVTMSGSGGYSGSILPAIPGAPTEERIQLDKITTLNTIKQQEFLQKVRQLTEERDEQILRNTLMMERLRAELAPLEHEQRKLQLKGQMADEGVIQAAAALRYQRDKTRLDNELAREKLAADQIKADADRLRRDIVVAELDFQARKLRQEADLADNKTVAIKADLELREKKDAWKKQANREPEYEKEPFKNGVLTVTDRRIPIEGPIVYGTADFVTERIHYFNNKSEEYPIFLVIDRSPGGSVMEGYRILKAMQASKAPVHVVVKSYAASMAATIATLAPHWYAYPNAVILHHQIWSVLFGNPTQQKQQLDTLKEWDRRLREPIARKMGTTMDKFTAEMYKQNVDGDWEEFADAAVRLKWIDHVVHEIRETGMLKEPVTKLEDKPKLAFGLSEESDAKGDRFVRLPRLQHSDAYFLYNRDSYYR